MPLTPGTPLKTLVLRQLDTVGDGSGIKNIIQDYFATGPTLIRYDPEPDQVLLMAELSIQYSDAGTFQQNVYASLPNPLVNGVSVNLYNRDGSVARSFTDGQFVTRNDEWYRLGYRFIYNNWAGSNQNTLVASLHSADFGSPLVIDGTVGQFLAVSVNDDFTPLVSQTFTVKGVLR